MNALRALFRFTGGVKPPGNKQDSTRLPIAPAPLPPQLVVPLQQSVGGQAFPLVRPGQAVLRGERLAAADGNVSAAVHAPTSGRVVALEPRRIAHPSGLQALCAVIEPDGEDRWAPAEPIDIRALAPDEVRDALRDAGVVGLGGAVFPAHLKLKPGREGRTEVLVINGAECEPYITCDDLLMRERAPEVLAGALLMRQLLQAGSVLIGIEDNKPEALAALRAAVAACGESGVEVIAVPTRYPAGGAKQLIRVLTGIEVAHGRRSTDYGVQCFNVGTAYALRAAIVEGRPLVSRIVTVAGNVEQARNYEVRIGTPMDWLLRQAGLRADSDGLIMGGPMMGQRMPSPDVPVVKATNCVLATSPRLFPPPPPEQACIRCGECARACPADLQPFELYWFARAQQHGKAQEYHLFDCIECGCCAYVCPAHIPLVDYFRYAKSEIWARERQQADADAARARFEFRQLRQEREKQERAERLAAKAPRKLAEKAQADEAAQAAGFASAREAKQAVVEAALADPGALPADPKQALIAAALARAQAQRGAAAPRNTLDLTPEQQAQVEAAEARRAAATKNEPPA